MKYRLQLGVLLAAMLSFAALPGSLRAQKQNPNRPPQPSHPAQPQNHAQQPKPPAQNVNHPPANNKVNPNPNRPPANVNHPNEVPPHNAQSNFNRADRAPNNGGLTPRQQVGVGTPRPWVDQMRSMSPAQRDSVLQNSKAFQNLSPDKQNKIRQQFSQWDHMTPAQQSDLRQREQTWRELTPQQRDHIKNDVLPKMRQMPWDRQQMIKQKLGVLQNMPESARNQRLADPNFTKGMTDEEKSTLQDLSHMHVGSAPEPPSE
ncbi:MAG: DUF3106 domain-containing protein [Candidatus Acidiferrum sp.]